MNIQSYEAASRGIEAFGKAMEQLAERKAKARRLSELRMHMEAQEKRAAEAHELNKRLIEARLNRENQEAEARQHEARGRIEADAMRRWGKNWDEFGDFVRRESDPVTLLNREKAQRELDLMRATPGANPADAALAADVNRLRLQKEKESLTAPAAPLVPMAKVTQNFGNDGKSHAEFQMPVAEFKKTMGSSGYTSPYAEDIAELGRQIADQESEIEGGDERTGFLGIATSRKGVADQARRKMRKFQALELQDMLARGVIDQAEADRRADVILSQR